MPCHPLNPKSADFSLQICCTLVANALLQEAICAMYKKRVEGKSNGQSLGTFFFELHEGYYYTPQLPGQLSQLIRKTKSKIISRQSRPLSS
jgi:hypothetical protein